MRLQNTPRNQALADKKAQEGRSFFFADYVGIHEGKLVYQAMHEGKHSLNPVFTF